MVDAAAGALVPGGRVYGQMGLWLLNLLLSARRNEPAKTTE